MYKTFVHDKNRKKKKQIEIESCHVRIVHKDFGNFDYEDYTIHITIFIDWAKKLQSFF